MSQHKANFKNLAWTTDHIDSLDLGPGPHPIPVAYTHSLTADTASDPAGQAHRFGKRSISPAQFGL